MKTKNLNQCLKKIIKKRKQNHKINYILIPSIQNSDPKICTE